MTVVIHGMPSHFRCVETKPYMRKGLHSRIFKMEQFCPIAKEWRIMLVPGNNWTLVFRSEDETPVPDGECVISDRKRDALKDIPNYIIVCKEKHGTNYYDAHDTESIGNTAIHILKERMKLGYYSEEINLKDIIEFNDFANAFDFLLSRDGYEYEGFEIIPIITIVP